MDSQFSQLLKLPFLIFQLHRAGVYGAPPSNIRNKLSHYINMAFFTVELNWHISLLQRQKIFTVPFFRVLVTNIKQLTVFNAEFCSYPISAKHILVGT